MAVKTTLAQLEEVQTAITNCLSAQESGDGDQKIVRAQLDSLTKRESILLARYRSEQNTSGGLPSNTMYLRRN